MPWASDDQGARPGGDCANIIICGRLENNVWVTARIQWNLVGESIGDLSLHGLERIGFIRFGMPYVVSHRLGCIKVTFSVSRIARVSVIHLLIWYIKAISYYGCLTLLFVRLHRYKRKVCCFFVPFGVFYTKPPSSAETIWYQSEHRVLGLLVWLWPMHAWTPPSAYLHLTSPNTRCVVPLLTLASWSSFASTASFALLVLLVFHKTVGERGAAECFHLWLLLTQATYIRPQLAGMWLSAFQAY